MITTTMTRVVSSVIRAVGYDPHAHVLVIEFRHGGRYRYFGVPEAVFRALLAAASKGRYFDENIKGHYPFSHD